MRLIEFKAEADWIGAIVAELSDSSSRAMAEGRGKLNLCLSGGNTVGKPYQALATGPSPELPVEAWLVDERFRGTDHPERNGRLVETSFSACAWPRLPRFHAWPWPWEGEAPGGAGLVEARELCEEYGAELLACLGPQPSFDLVLIGVGADGHIAGLFPGQGALVEERELATTSWAPSEPRLRMTLTYPALRGARRVRYLARGAAKRETVRRLAAGDPSLPAARVGVEDQAILFCVD